MRDFKSMKNIGITIVLTISLFATSFPQTVPDEDGQVVKVSTDLIQLDVSVTDKNGKVVSGLSQDDFELFENGERQVISNFGFVSRTAGGASSGSASPRAGSPAAFSKKPLTASAVRRTIAVVVDDLNLSFGSIHLARKSLRKFVDEQMEPDDLVAIIRTRGGVGALQQFTSDKRILHSAIDRLRWNPSAGFDSLSSVSQRDSDITERFTRESDNVAGGKSKTQTVVLVGESAHDKKSADGAKNTSSQESGIYVQSSLGAIKYVVSGMGKLPGRKAMMLFSDGIDIGNDSVKSRASSIYGYLQDIADLANRSSVVVYTFDTKGMRSMSITASDNTYEIIDGHRGQKETARLNDFRDSQDGLVYFADRTGGRAFLNSDNLNWGIERAMEEQAGYYLLAYVPDSDNFDAAKRRFGKLDIKVKRPGLRVSYRSGFFTGGGEQAAPSNITSSRNLANVLVSPFTQNDIALNIGALYADDKTDGPYVRSFLHIDARNLKFHDDPSGWKVATFDILAAAFGDNGVPADSKESTYTIKTKGATYEAMLERGFVYVLPVPLKKPGLYQFRVAVRDTDTGAIGSAYQILEVPDISKRGMVLSSLAVENVSNDTWQKISSGKVGTRPGQVQIPSTLLYDTVLRRFKAGSVLRYGYEVYDEAGTTQIETRATIHRDNAVVMNGSTNRVDVSNQKDPRRIKLSGAITLAGTLEPGDYVLQIAVFDRAKNLSATQVLPFEIVQ